MLTCRKTEVRESAAQWNLDALVGTPGGDILPCFVASPPQMGKGGSCGGEEEDAEFPFTGSMISATWEFPKERKGAVLASIRGLFGLTGGPSG